MSMIFPRPAREEYGTVFTKEQYRNTKTTMAAKMKTDRRQLDRLLDPENKSVTQSTLWRAATELGRKLHVRIA
jgi:hypothetical protein